MGSPSLKKRLTAGLDRFVPPARRGQDDEDARRTRVFVAFSLVVGGSFLLFFLRALYGGHYNLVAIDGAGLVVVFANLEAFRRNGRRALHGNVLTTVIFLLMCSISATTGGVGMPATYMLGLMPLIAISAISARSGLFWGAMSALAMLGLGVAYAMQVRFPDPFPTEGLPAMTVVGGLATTGIAVCVGLATEWIKDSALTRIETANAQLKIAEEAARAASLAKSQFLANMSHEIRTPMNGVLGTLQLMRMKEDLDEDSRELTGTALSTAQALLVLLDDLIDLAKVESGKLEFESVPVDLERIAREVIRLFTAEAHRKGLRIGLEVVGSAATAAMSDPVRVRQILSNLVGNAVKFTRSGEVRLELAQDRPDTIDLRVRDSGIGIAGHQVEHIFDTFGQADSGTSRRYGGSGLGLSVSKRLVEGLSGKIEVDSKLGEGSMFHVCLPYVPAPVDWTPAEAPTAVSQDAFVHVKKPILLVEDNTVNAMVGERMIAALGLDIERCDSGREAVDRASDGEFALILMDCHMPDYDGFAATEELRRRGIRTPIVALTASAMAADRERCFASGMDGFLSKPIAQEDLAIALQAWLPQSG